MNGLKVLKAWKKGKIDELISYLGFYSAAV